MIYLCPVHGELPDLECIQSTLDGTSEKFCLRCWRDWLRQNISLLTVVNFPEDEVRE